MLDFRVIKPHNAIVVERTLTHRLANSHLCNSSKFMTQRRSLFIEPPKWPYADGHGRFGSNVKVGVAVVGFFSLFGIVVGRWFYNISFARVEYINEQERILAKHLNWDVEKHGMLYALDKKSAFNKKWVESEETDVTEEPNEKLN